MATPEEYGLKSFLEVYTITRKQANRLAYKAGWISSGDEIGYGKKFGLYTLQIYDGIPGFEFFDTEEEREAKIKELRNKGAYIRGSFVAKDEVIIPEETKRAFRERYYDEYYGE